MLAVAFVALWVGAAPSTADRAIEIEFPHELDLSPKSHAPVPLRARWVHGKDSNQTTGPLLNAWASFGTIREFHREAGTETYAGEWLAPDPPVPGLLLIVVSTIQNGRPVYSAQSTEVWAEIDLPGRSEPGAQVEIVLPGAKFGPVAAGADGKFKLPVRVPPHVDKATARSRDRLGNTYQKTVDLFVPKFSELALVCPRRAVMAGGPPLPLAIASDHTLAGEVSAKASAGGIDPELRFLPPTQAGTVTITATSKKLGAQSCTVEVAPGPADRLQMRAEPEFVVADGAAQQTIEVMALDRLGNETADVDVRCEEQERPLSISRRGQKFVAALTSIKDRDRRELRCSAARVAQRCEAGEQKDFRGLPCAAGGRPELQATLAVEYIPERGVRLRVLASEHDKVRIAVVPASEARADAVVGVTAKGAPLTLVTDKPGELVTTLPDDGSSSVTFSHLQSGMSLTVPLGAHAP
jgi:hypothetical protein